MEAFEKWLIAEVTKGNVEISAEQAWKAALLHAAEIATSLSVPYNSDALIDRNTVRNAIAAAIRKEAGE